MIFVDDRGWLSLLAECVNLQEGTFRLVAAHRVPDPLETVDVELKHLTHLDVELNEMRGITMFDGFRFPNLTYLRIAGLTESTWFRPEHFYRQVGSLRTLLYDGHPEGLIELLRHTPSVIDLRISSPIFNLNTFVRPMQVKNEASEVLLPKLERLSLHNYYRCRPV